jgi:arginine/serine-rich splicing factor 17
MNKKQQEEEKKLESKIALEERKILIAQRKLESMRLLEELFNRVKKIVTQEEHEKYMQELKLAEKQREIDEANQENIKKMKLEQEVIK